MHLPDSDNLRSFVAAATHLNFRKAALDIGLTPAAFGQRIKQLEHQIGAPLFHRSTRSVRLTDTGAALLPRALEAIEELKRCLSPLAEVNAIQLTIGTRFELGLSWVQPSLNLIQQSDFRPFHYDLFFSNGPTLNARLIAGELDAVISSSHIHHPLIEQVDIHEETYVLVASPKLTGRLTKDRAHQIHLIDTSYHLNLFSYWSRLHGKILDAYHFKSIRIRGTIASIRQAILNNEGIAALPYYFVKDDLKHKRLRQLYGSQKLARDSFRMLYNRHNSHATYLHALAQRLRQYPLV